MIRVLIVDDHPAVQAGLEALLRREPGLVPVAVASDAVGALDALSRGAVDVALVDYMLGGEDGVGVTQALCAAKPELAVAIYSGAVDTNLHVAGRLAGAMAVLTKGAPASDLFDVLRQVARGEPVRPDDPARLLSNAGMAFAEEDRPILALLLDGCTRAEAASALGMTREQLNGRTASMLARLRNRRSGEGATPVAAPHVHESIGA